MSRHILTSCTCPMITDMEIEKMKQNTRLFQISMYESLKCEYND